MLEIAIEAAMPLIQDNGLVCEFGVGSGTSIRLTREILPLDVPIHGFDTFTGIPQAWGNEPAGSYSTGGIIPNMEGNVQFHVGLFSETLGPFLDSAGKEAFLAYANIDCDLYSSTLDVLEAMHGRIVPGTVRSLWCLLPFALTILRSSLTLTFEFFRFSSLTSIYAIPHGDKTSFGRGASPVRGSDGSTSI